MKKNRGIVSWNVCYNFKFGACEKEMLRHVRPPKDHEKDGEGFSVDELKQNLCSMFAAAAMNNMF